MAFSGMINVKTGQLTLGGQFDAYKRGQLERNIHCIGHIVGFDIGVIGGTQKGFNSII